MKQEKTDPAAAAAPAAPVHDPMVVLQGRLDAFSQELRSQMTAMREQLAGNTAALDRMTDRFGDLAIAAPRLPPDEQPLLSRQQIQEILAKHPSASFRLMQDVRHPLFTRDKGAIIRPQPMATNVWRMLLDSNIQLTDADEHP